MTKTEGRIEVVNHVKDTTQVVLQYVRKEYDIPKFDVDIKFSETRTRSWGGTRGGMGFIDLAISRYITAAKENDKITFNEYPSFCHSLVIGSVIDVNWKIALTALVVHEIAHAVQYYNPKKAVDALAADYGVITADQFRGHKKLWKTIYADLRKKFVNGLIQTPVVQPKVVTTKIVEPKKVVPVVQPKVVTKTTTPTSKKNWVVVKTRMNGGVKVEYLDAVSGKLLLTLFDKKSTTILMLDTQTSTWVNTHTSDRIEVRNRYLNNV